MIQRILKILAAVGLARLRWREEDFTYGLGDGSFGGKIRRVYFYSLGRPPKRAPRRPKSPAVDAAQQKLPMEPPK